MREARESGERIFCGMLDREEPTATTALERTGGHVETGLVIWRLSLGWEEAKSAPVVARGLVTRDLGELDR